MNNKAKHDQLQGLKICCLTMHNAHGVLCFCVYFGMTASNGLILVNVHGGKEGVKPCFLVIWAQFQD